MNTALSRLIYEEFFVSLRDSNPSPLSFVPGRLFLPYLVSAGAANDIDVVAIDTFNGSLSQTKQQSR